MSRRKQKEPQSEEYLKWKAERDAFWEEKNKPLRLAEEMWEEERTTRRKEFIKAGLKVPPQYLAQGDVRARLTWMKGKGWIWKEYLVDHNQANQRKRESTSSKFMFGILPRITKFVFYSALLYGGFKAYEFLKEPSPERILAMKEKQIYEEEMQRRLKEINSNKQKRFST